jgi:hypothetical protein
MTGTCSVVFGLFGDLGMVKMKEWNPKLTKYSSVGWLLIS